MSIFSPATLPESGITPTSAASSSLACFSISYSRGEVDAMGFVQRDWHCTLMRRQNAWTSAVGEVALTVRPGTNASNVEVQTEVKGGIATSLGQKSPQVCA